MRISFALVAILATSAYANYGEFQEWSVKFAKKYATKEEAALRYSIFKDNLKIINEHNAGNHNYYMRLNDFSDLVFDEFIAHKGMPEMAQRDPIPYTPDAEPPMRAAYKTGIDWSTLGAVTPVPDQEDCNSCYAFSATGSLETAWWYSNSTLIKLSDQQIVDCTNNSFYDNYGCSGGWQDYSYWFVMDNGGMCSEADYPYVATAGTCRTNCTNVVSMTNFHAIPSFSQHLIEDHLHHGTIASAFHANYQVQHYGGGYFDSTTCLGNINHAVLTVGYGLDSSDREFYRIRNSWGATWGDGGYMTLAKGGPFTYYGQCVIHFLNFRAYTYYPWI